MTDRKGALIVEVTTAAGTHVLEDVTRVGLRGSWFFVEYADGSGEAFPEHAVQHVTVSPIEEIGA